MKVIWQNTREREKFFRRLDVLCVILLSAAIVFIVVCSLGNSEPTFIPVDVQEVTSNRRKCPKVAIHWADINILPQGNKQEHGRLSERNAMIEQKEDPVVRPMDWRELAGISAKEKKSQSKMNKKVCPEYPKNIKGEIECVGDLVTPEVIISKWLTLMSGGRLRPLTCTAREKLAIIIPFMNRTAHLHTLINNLLPVLHRQQVDVTFFVVEQIWPPMFNRATLHNIGFLESQKLDEYDCYIFHDVDLVPLDDRILYRCAENPRHFAVSIKRYGQLGAQKMYDDYFGGIVALSKEQYIDVNGNSNLYFGWGGEDDDLLIRVLNKGYTRVRENANIFQYEMLHHERNDYRRGNVDRMLLLHSAADRQDFEGLSTTTYKVEKVSIDHLYVWIRASFNMTELLLTAPDFARSGIRSLLNISKSVT